MGGLPVICGLCRGENPPGMKFCRSCGAALGPGSSGAHLPTAPGGPMPLGGPLPLGGPHGPAYGGALGAPLMPPPGGVPMMPPPGGAPLMPLGGAPLMPLGGPLPPPPGAPPIVVAAPGSGTITCPRCGITMPTGFAYCQQCGLHMQALQPTDPGTSAARPRSPSQVAGPVIRPSSAPGIGLGALNVDPQGATLATEGLRGPSMGPPPGVLPSSPALALAPVPAGSAAIGPAWGTAVLVNRDGSDGQRYPLAGEYAVVGRAGADIAFDDDRFLARQHARFERDPSGLVRLLALDTLNGVFRKTDGSVELVDGMMVLVGREVLRYERVTAEETKIQPLIRHGVALFGSPPREPWGRLMQVVPSGGHRDVRHLCGDEVVLGREEGDIVFRDDAFMSRRHAAVTWDGKRAQVTDLGSSNGTFVRITGPSAIKHGDHVRMGDQLLRIELR